jgi:CBS domain-containing protein
MIAKELISDMIMPLYPDDTVDQVLSMMSIYHVKHMAVVSNGILLGILSEEDATNVHPNTPLRDVKLSNTYAYVKASDHIFDVLSNMAENRTSIIPVVDDEEKFIGIITQEDLISYYANSFSFTEPGSIIVIETTRRGYSLSEIARIVEMENTAILASFLSVVDNSELVYLTLKLNKSEISSIIATLDRYEYKVSASFTEEENSDDLKDRYDQLMNYLNV